MIIDQLTRQFIREHIHDDPRNLALQASRFPDIDMAFALSQIAGRQAVRDKLPSWYENEHIIYPVHLSLEQCSSELTARYKSTLVSGSTLADLTGGFGVDSACLSQSFLKTAYVERQKELCELASVNFQALNHRNISVHQADAGEFLSEMAPVDCIYLDPARRNMKGQKVHSLSDCEPDILSVKSLLFDKAPVVLLKLSPMLDITATIRLLPETREVHVVSVHNECKELLFLLHRDSSVDEYPIISAVNLQKGKTDIYSFGFADEADAICSQAHELADYLYEPSASVLKAGAYKSIASAYGLEKLHPNTHLYTGNECIADFPGRVFRIVNSGRFNKADIRGLLSGIRKANITVRNFPATVDELRKRLKLADGGDIYLFAATMYRDEKRLIVCEKVERAI